MKKQDITPDFLLNAYAMGAFPMAESRDDPTLFWVDPDERGIFPLDAFHIPKRLKRTVAQNKFSVTVNKCFRNVMQACAKSSTGRDETWINHRIEDLYCALHDNGYAHSVECWQDGKLVGGLYGVCFRGAFFGESMFHTVTDASKVALVHLVGRLIAGGFKLLDAQFKTDHLEQFGLVEIFRAEYHSRLEEALLIDADFYVFGSTSDGATVLQPITQTS